MNVRLGGIRHPEMQRRHPFPETTTRLFEHSISWCSIPVEDKFHDSYLCSQCLFPSIRATPLVPVLYHRGVVVMVRRLSSRSTLFHMNTTLKASLRLCAIDTRWAVNLVSRAGNLMDTSFQNFVSTWTISGSRVTPMSDMSTVIFALTEIMSRSPPVRKIKFWKNGVRSVVCRWH